MDLIVTADDYGLTRGINYGIYDACLEGIVNSVGLLMNTKHTDHGISLMENMTVGIGISLNMTYGKPLVADGNSLQEYGFFKPIHDWNEIDNEAVINEFKAQIDLALSKGVPISFLSSYENVHLKHDGIYKIIDSLASEYDLNFRKKSDEDFEFCDLFYDRMVNLDFLTQLLMQYKGCKTVELVVHPGFLCGHLINISSYRELRLVEHSILTSAFVKSFIKDRDIMLKTYQDIDW
ncbi:MAG: ChbG/HpnK family deacetylase [Clostridiales bacterium]|nr:ChbG/HpnK family deacetylase [Clostridiales bacterium]